jgi:hypothetical protein
VTAPFHVDVKLNWPLATVIVVTMIAVSTCVCVFVIYGILSEAALWALGAWLAGMVKGSLVPAVFYKRVRVSVRGDSPRPPPP